MVVDWVRFPSSPLTIIQLAMKTVIITIKGGVVTDVITDEKVNVVILDQDTEYNPDRAEHIPYLEDDAFIKEYHSTPDSTAVQTIVKDLPK